MRRTAVFDLDGTLADTTGDLIAAVNICLEGYGMPLNAAADQITALGGGRAMLRLGLARAGRMDEALVDRLYPELLRHYEAGIAVRSRLYDGVAASLTGLLADGWKLGVCTNKPAYLADILLEKLGIRALFGPVLGADSLAVRKPDPLHLLETIRLCGGTAGRAVMVGDTATDRVTAQKAGVPCILVTFGPAGEAVRTLEPEGLLAHFDDLPALLEGMMPA